MILPRIGISIGDPAGIGPEVSLRALFGNETLPPAQYVLFGPRPFLENEAKDCGVAANFGRWSANRSCVEPGVYLRDLPAPEGPVKKGVSGSSCGRASFAWFEEAAVAARKREIEAVVTAPISKLSWNLAGISWRGHTEYLESFYPDAVMSFWSDRLTVALLSHHLPLREALARVTPQALARLFRVLHECAAGRTPGANTEILVAGLNPHAGENGLLGTEEREIIVPAIEEARRAGIPVRGPFPPDVVFRNAIGRPERIVAALYHDQGLIPFKLTAFETGVNVTLGLPFVRTSPDHGTAFDIAGKTPADPGSMIEALRLAVVLTTA
ncbi:MAG: 4-hydroxythreonine-4-phosphate dehydrogenase PdxA [Candidatus Aminicenantes bacterium]|nr:4-hydroxythreonine-4-phosphate dehydrogenase PdxA [Candidatus Aminicenantes bacterium]